MYFVNAQKNRNDWWRYLVGIVIVGFAYLILGSIPLALVVILKTMNGSPMDMATFMETYNTEAIGINQNLGLILLLFPSVFAFFVLWFVMTGLHGKKAGEIASSEGRIRWSRLFSGAIIWLVLLVAAEWIFAYFNPENYQFHFNAAKFYPLLIIAFLFIPFQTWFEELLFRSYLMVGFGLATRLRIAALLITSIAFGLLHSFNPEVKEFGFLATMPYYVGFGIFAGILVIMDNGIELAFGVHAINNIYGAVFVTYESSVLKTPALWSIQKINPWFLDLAFLLMAGIFIWIMSKLYSWNSWKRIFTPIPKLNSSS